MSYMFYGYSSIKELNVSNFNTNNVNIILIKLKIWVVCSMDAYH